MSWVKHAHHNHILPSKIEKGDIPMLSLCDPFWSDSQISQDQDQRANTSQSGAYKGKFTVSTNLLMSWQTYWGAFLFLCAASLRVRGEHETPREGAIAPQHIFLILGTVFGASNRVESKIEECCFMHLTVKVSRKEVSLKYSHKCIVSDYG